MKILRNPHLISLVAILVFLSFVSVGNFYEHKRLEEIQMCQAADAALLSAAFPNLENEIIGKVFYVYNFSKGKKIVGRSENAAYPLASLTKLMTIRVVLRNQAEPEMYTVKEEDLNSDNAIGFVAGDTFRVRDLIRAALVGSSNDAAVMLAHSTGLSEDAFSQVMNIEAKNQNLSSLRFESATGLDTKENEPTAIGSARDIAVLLYNNNRDFPLVLADSALPQTRIAATNGRSIEFESTNHALGRFDSFIAGKTGYTISAGGNLAVLWKTEGGDTIAGIVLGSTEEGRFEDMVRLHDGTKKYLASLPQIPTLCKRINYYESN